MARGVDGRDIFIDSNDRCIFLETLTKLKREVSFTLFAYCLMGNHFHLALKTREVPLSRIIQRLLTRYVGIFNSRHERTGHLFQARYKAVICVKEGYLLRLIRYIHDNPVRSGIVTNDIDWPWSSSSAYSSGDDTSLIKMKDLPATLGSTDDPDTPGEAFDPWELKAAALPPLTRNDPAEKEPLDKLAMRVAMETHTPLVILRSARRDASVVSAKRSFAIRSLNEGHRLTDIARWLGCTPAAAHYLAYAESYLKN